MTTALILLFGILSLSSRAADAAGRRALRVRGRTPCENRRWHIDIENPTQQGCSNSWKVPNHWRLPEHKARMFYDSYEECCSFLYGDGECNIANLCDEVDPQQAEDDHCGRNPKWHIDLDTKVGCTNNPRFPDSWKDVVDYFFDTPESCCQKFVDRGVPCTVHDICGRQLHNEMRVIMIAETVEAPQNVTGKIPLYHA